MSTRNYAAASIEGGYDLIGSDVIKCDILFDTTKFTMLVGSATLTDANADSALLNESTTGSIITKVVACRWQLPCNIRTGTRMLVLQVSEGDDSNIL